MWVEYNPNPSGKSVGDCVIRAVAKVLDLSWEEAYAELCLQGYMMHDMPSANEVWGAYLKSKGFKREMIPASCADCYTIEDFTKEYPKGVYVIGTGKHAVACIDGKTYDSWDSEKEAPLYFYRKVEA